MQAIQHNRKDNQPVHIRRCQSLHFSRYSSDLSFFDFFFSFISRVSRFVILCALCGAALSGCGKKDAAGGGEAAGGEVESAAPVTVEMATPAVQAVEITVGAQGTLSPGQGANVRVTAPIAGRLLGVYANEGQHVTMGQKLAVVDNRPQQAQAKSAQAALIASEAQARSARLAAGAAQVDQTGSVRTARLALEAANLDREATVRQAQNALESAQTDLARTKAGARPQEIAQAEQTITQAQATRDRAQTEVTRVQFLFDKGIAAKRQLDDAQTALAVANSALTSSQQASSLLRAGARPEEARAAQLRVDAARDALVQAQKSGDARILQARAALQQAERSRLNVSVKQSDAQAMQDMVNQKQADYAAAQATASYAEIRAPIDGTITKRNANAGDMADVTTPILEISNTRGLNLVANLPAEDGLKVKAGMAAHVATSDVPGKTFPGRVLNVGQVDPQTNLLSIRIAVANPGSLRVGAFATADIVLRRIRRAIVVPKSAVVTQDGKPTVYTVSKDDKAQAHVVTIGPEVNGGKMVALLNGLEAGQPVVSVGNYELTDGAKTKASEAGSDDKPDAAGKKSDDKDDKKDEKKDEKSGAKADDKSADKADGKSATPDEKGGKP